MPVFEQKTWLEKEYPETYKKIAELAERWIPEPVKWFIPEGFDPSSYIHPVMGMTKSAFIRGISQLTNNPAIRRVAGRVAKKILRPLQKVGTYEQARELFPTNPGLLNAIESPSVRASTMGGNLASSHQRAGATRMINRAKQLAETGNAPPDAWEQIRKMEETLKNLPFITLKEGATSRTAVPHEAGHLLWWQLPKKERKSMTRLYGRLNDMYLTMLEHLSRSSLQDAEELFAEGYGHYLAGTPTFREFPPHIRHYLKKYHRMMR